MINVWERKEFEAGDVPKDVQRQMSEREEIQVDEFFVYPHTKSIIEKDSDGAVTVLTDGEEKDFSEEVERYQEISDNLIEMRQEFEVIKDESAKRIDDTFNQATQDTEPTEEELKKQIAEDLKNKLNNQ